VLGSEFLEKGFHSASTCVRATERADDLWKQLFSKLTMALSDHVYPVGLLIVRRNCARKLRNDREATGFNASQDCLHISLSLCARNVGFAVLKKPTHVRLSMCDVVSPEMPAFLT
jgi:hypothetical protein